MDFGGSMLHVFGETWMSKTADTIKPPSQRCNISYHPETLAPMFDNADDGECYLWCNLDSKNRPPHRQYAIGCDVATGLGGSFRSNSAMVGVDLLTREQVFEFASNTIEPADFADFAIAVAKWFYDAYLAWEHNGPGTAFTRRVLDKQYKHFYQRTVLWKRGRKKNKEVGWWTDARSKETLFADLIMAVRQEELVIRSKFLREEASQYTRSDNTIVHAIAATTQDDSSSGAQHGDRVIAMGVAYQAMKDRPLKGVEKEEAANREPPMNTMAWRQREWEREQKRALDAWDSSATADLLGVLHDCRR